MPAESVFGSAPATGWSDEPVEQPPDRSLFGAPAQPVAEPEPEIAPVEAPALQMEPLLDASPLTEVPLAAPSDFVTFQREMPGDAIDLPAAPPIELGNPEDVPVWQGQTAFVEPPAEGPETELASTSDFISYQGTPGDAIEAIPDAPPIELASAADFVTFQGGMDAPVAAPVPPVMPVASAPAAAATPFAPFAPPAAPVAAPSAPPRPIVPPPAYIPPAPSPAIPNEWAAPAPAQPFMAAPLAPVPPAQTFQAPRPMAAPILAPAPAYVAPDSSEMIEEIDVVEIDSDFESLPPLATSPAPVPQRPPPPSAPPRIAPAAVAPPAEWAAPQAPVVPFRPVAPAPAPVAARPAPVAVAPAPAPMSAVVIGEHRVVLHTLAGQVKRGTLRGPNLDAEVLDLEVIPGQPPERLPTKGLKAVFFLLPPGAKPPTADGAKVRVTFFDERQVAGFAPAYRPTDNGFFMFPADTRTNTARIYIFRSAVKSIARG